MRTAIPSICSGHIDLRSEPPGGTGQLRTGQAVLRAGQRREPAGRTTGPGLVCYSIKDDSGTPKFSGATVAVLNSDLFAGQLAVKKSKTFCTIGFGQPVGP